MSKKRDKNARKKQVRAKPRPQRSGSTAPTIMQPAPRVQPTDWESDFEDLPEPEAIPTGGGAMGRIRTVVKSKRLNTEVREGWWNQRRSLGQWALIFFLPLVVIGIAIKLLL